MPDRQLIIRLDGRGLDGSPATLMVYSLDGSIEVVATEKHGADASVVLESAQAKSLAQAVTAALKKTFDEDAG